jgi:hypothetical protein
VQDPAAELARVRGDVLRALWFADDPPRIRDHLCVCTTSKASVSGIGDVTMLAGRTPVARCIDGESTHRIGDYGRRATVDAAAEREEISLGPRAAEVVPQPARRAEPIALISTNTTL